MKLLVLRKSDDTLFNNCHDCRVIGEDGEVDRWKTMRVDFWVDGSLTQEEYDDIVGKTVECDYTHPYISIASGVRIV